MFVEVSANHFAVLRPIREGDSSAVHADKPFSIVVDERKKGSFLFRVHFQFATGIEEHGVKIVQIFSVVLEFFLRQHFGICPDCRSPQSRFLAEALNSSDGVGNGLVPVAFLFSEDQKMLRRLSGRLRPAAATECHKENEQYHSSHLHLSSSTFSCHRANYFWLPSQI